VAIRAIGLGARHRSAKKKQSIHRARWQEPRIAYPTGQRGASLGQAPDDGKAGAALLGSRTRAKTSIVAALTAYPVRAPQWQLIYQGVNITADVSRSVIGITYVDRLSENSGEAEVTLEDHNKLWQGAWYPQQGDVVSLALG